ncbi:DUF3494 domain-containing protein [Kaistella sp. G5-32]|uniref:DUF3494 domain-containing protein n=1 Tax=Kaistella gelatinilytica TaxID=2787636 RepID=A0ABS0F8H3_9FLAO|nr:ice-binding family protein [Kaistella gelatinilytica]MBF8456006.1 DUF3494 domain-containing protein [Kaistella gelatinilytica]
MKLILKLFLMFIAISIPKGIYAQIGINTTTIDPSSALEIFSEDKGLLMPRLTTIQRDNIVLPASGLMIYNSTLNDGQINTGTSDLPTWEGIKSRQSSAIVQSVTKGDVVTTNSLVYEVVSGMSITPPAGTYLTLFNGLIDSNYTFSSQQGVLDVHAIFTELMNFPGGVTHGLVFGNNEILLPGVYDVAGAPSIAGTVTLDGQNDPNALFIIRGTGAFTTGVSSKVDLINGARACNIFWVCGGAMSTADPTTMKGTLISNAAIALGAHTTHNGRLLSTMGAITMGAGTVLKVTTGASLINFRSLHSFAMFTADGAISGCDLGCSITGDVGTANGIPTAFAGLIGEIYGPGTRSTSNASMYSIFKDNVEVLESSRTILLGTTVPLQAIVTVAAGETINVRWKVDKGTATLHQRIFSIIRAGN